MTFDNAVCFLLRGTKELIDMLNLPAENCRVFLGQRSVWRLCEVIQKASYKLCAVAKMPGVMWDEIELPLLESPAAVIKLDLNCKQRSTVVKMWSDPDSRSHLLVTSWGHKETTGIFWNRCVHCPHLSHFKPLHPSKKRIPFVFSNCLPLNGSPSIRHPWLPAWDRSRPAQSGRT